MDARRRHFCFDPARTNCSDGDAATDNLQRKRSAEADHAVLGRAVGRISGHAKLSQHRRDIDHPACSVSHLSERGFGYQVQAVQVRINDVEPLAVVGIRNQAET